MQKPRSDECERKRNRIIQNNGKTTEEKSTRMRRVPFFLSRLLFANKFNEEGKGKKCEIGQMGKIPKLVQKVQCTAHSQKQGKRKERKERPSRRHIDVTSVAIVLRSTTVF